MPSKTKLDKDALLNLYYENKELMVPIFAIVVSILLFLVFIIPQLLSFPSRRSAVDAETEILDKIKESEKILSTANTDLINSQVQVAARTLPQQKPLEEAVGAIFTAAGLSNLQISNYSFQESLVANVGTNLQSISFNVSIIGDLSQAADFADQIYRTYPLSAIENISSKDGDSSVSILFYYAPFVIGSLSDRTSVRLQTEKEKAALDEILKWNEAIGGDILNLTPSSSSSGEVNDSPF